MPQPLDVGESKTYRFTIVSKKYGLFTVIAPVRFRAEIEARRWSILRTLSRAPGRQFSAKTNKDGRGGTLYLHRFIWELSGRPFAGAIDHKDGDPLNNAEDNLRDGTGVNPRNMRRPAHNRSGVMGVFWSSFQEQWQARIKVNGRLVHVGFFDDIDEARIARDRAALVLHGEFASLNGPVPPGLPPWSKSERRNTRPMKITGECP